MADFEYVRIIENIYFLIPVILNKIKYFKYFLTIKCSPLKVIFEKIQILISK